MTINKSQGQTFDRLGKIFVKLFLIGQLYVAFSQVLFLESIKNLFW